MPGDRARSWRPSPSPECWSARRAPAACPPRAPCRRPAVLGAAAVAGARPARRGAAGQAQEWRPAGAGRCSGRVRSRWRATTSRRGLLSDKTRRASLKDGVGARTLGAAAAGSAGASPACWSAGVALDGGRDHDRRAQGDLGVLGHAVEGGDRPVVRSSAAASTTASLRAARCAAGRGGGRGRKSKAREDSIIGSGARSWPPCPGRSSS